MLPILSAFLFMLLALELSLMTKKSTKEGYYAFITPRIKFSEGKLLGSKLRKMLKAGDQKAIRTLLTDSGILKAEGGYNLESLQDLEVSLAREHERLYNRVLYYLPEDLQSFFRAVKTIWDAQNLKLLLRCVSWGFSPEWCTRMMGAFGYISPSQVEELSRSRDLRDLSKNIIAILPIDLASKLEIKPEKPLALLEASIDQAVCRYIKARSEEIGTREVRQSWDLLARMYEIKNLSLIARLKRFNVPSDQIKPFLFPCSAEVDERFLRALLESTDYPAFIQLLRETHYGRYLPTTKDELSPAAIEEILMEALLKKMVSEIPSEDGLEAAIRYMINLELEFQTIREAAFFAIIKGNGGRNP